ncbi:unnamed protein product [Vitrella brassicaformis CCMP3155]|uniref:Uncharacterized protein n=1 Tax=Vitrella brassicaformis (strain CCMP3155) TaxID=1169540 RepID=A0A0G4FS64_VITBC|nr:unnamed protein product [Vitrella brassicaformis CCMP3155]|eukprot:CEM17498.1 unnamed protein product [Vitrella brassicaformis CCMP3155]
MFPVPPPPPPSVGSFQCKTASLPHQRPYVGPPGPLPHFGRPPMPVTPPNGRFVQTVLQRGPGTRQSPLPPPPSMLGFTPRTPLSGCPSARHASNRTPAVPSVPPKFIAQPIVKERVIEIEKHEIEEQVVELPQTVYKEKFVEVPKKVIQDRIVYVRKPRVTRDPYRPVQAHRMASVQPPMNVNVAQLQRPTLEPGYLSSLRHQVVQDRIINVRQPRLNREPYRPVQAHRMASVQPPFNRNMVSLQKSGVYGAALVSPRLPHVRPPTFEHMMSNPFAAPPPAYGPSRRLEHLWSHHPPPVETGVPTVARNMGRAPGVGDVGGMAMPPMGAPARVVQYGQTGALRQGAGGTCLTVGSGMAAPLMAPKTSHQYTQAGAGREASHGTSLTHTRDGPRMVRVDLSSPSRRVCSPCSPPVCPPLLRSPPPARAGGPLNQRRGNTARRQPPLPPYMRRRS